VDFTRGKIQVTAKYFLFTMARPFYFMSVRVRMALICLIMVLCCGVVFLTVFWGDYSVKQADQLASRYSEAAKIADQINLHLQSVQVDKELLAEKVSADAKEKVAERIEKTQVLLRELQALNIHLPLDISETYAMTIDRISDLFNSYADALSTMGLSDEEGIRKTFVKAGVTLSTFMDAQPSSRDIPAMANISVTISTLRRLEKDVIYTASKRAEQAFFTNIALLRGKYNLTSENDQVTLNSLGKLIDYYEIHFGRYRSSQIEVEKASLVFDEALEAILPGVVELSGQARNLAERESENLIAYQIRARNIIYTTLLLTAALTLIAAALIAYSITHPIDQLQQAMNRLQKDDLTHPVTKLAGRNELSNMARALEAFRQHALRIKTLEREKQQALQERDEERRRTMAELNERFGSVVDAALQGDFSHRVETDLGHDSLDMLAHSINRLMTSFEKGMNALTDVVARLAEGDVQARMDGDFEGAFHTLQNHIDTMSRSLCELIADIANSSATLRDATNEILKGANDLSRRSAEQADTLKKTADSADTLAHFVKDSAQKAGEANELSRKTLDTTSHSGDVMQTMVETMDKIAHSSRRIHDVVDLIDDIAFQTNLLALNASVEAARAGEHGRGFAVVAEEVRRLAQSAAGSSGEIRDLVRSTTDDIQGGVTMAETMQQALNDVLAHVNKVSSIMNLMSHDSLAQSSRFEAINNAIRDLDLTTQKNVTLVEEANAAVQSSLNQAERLDQLVSAFRIAPHYGLEPAKNDVYSPMAQIPA
jgi:methyl-accepting chemotaxis protein